MMENRMHIDPVCGMEVKSSSEFRFKYRGKEYLFCSRHCLETFKRSPEDFVEREPSHSPHIHHAHHEHHEGMVEDFKRRFLISIIITIPVLILSPMIQEFIGVREILEFHGDIYLLFALSSAVFLYGGYPFLKGMRDELKAKLPGMMTLVGLAITVAYIYSSAVVFGLSGKIFFWELVTLIDIMLLGHWIEMKSVMKASHALEELVALMPSQAHLLLPDGSMRDVPIDELKVGDRVVVKPGEKVPADGEVVDGESYLNEALLTGESKPVHKKKGDRVIGGSINGDGSLTVEVHKTGKDSFVSQVINLVREAQETKSRTQDIADRAAFWLTVIAISIGTITLFVWFLLLSKPFSFSLERMVTVMVITCPHALGLAVPLVVAVSTALSAKNGLLIRNRKAFERAKDIQAILFDKTGTLTEGRFAVTDVVSLDENLSREEILKYARSVERYSEHPIAKGIVSSGSEFFEVREFTAIPGKGVQGIVNGKRVMVVSSGYLKEKKIEIEDIRVKGLLEQGKTVVFLMIDDELKGAIALGDVIRPESKEAIASLKRMGIRCMMITGDSRAVAKWVADELGLDEFFAEVLPHQKMEIVKEIQKRGYVVAMTGDGVNDAPALAQADVGIAIGAGTDVAVETADIVLIRSNPRDVLQIVKLARATYRKMIQNLLWATGYNLLAIPVAGGVLYPFGILLSPAVGAILMSLSTVIVAVNANLLKVD